jgi:hypothetical protein
LLFFHQSVTEFLAAGELARRYQESPQILEEKLSFTRWDQAIYLTLSLLPQEVEAMFLKSIIDTNFVLGLRATKYLEYERDEVVAKLLSEIPVRVDGHHPFEAGIELALRYGVPVREFHEAQLREIMACGNTIGGAAAQLLTELKGSLVKKELLQSLFDHRDDYNYCCNGIARAIFPFVEKGDLETLVAMADSIEDEVASESGEDIAIGFTTAIQTLLGTIDLPTISGAFLPSDHTSQVSEFRARILCSVLQSRHSTAALELSAELLLRGVNGAATAMYFVARFAKPEDNLSWSSFTKVHVDCLLSIVQYMNKKEWALWALECLCASRPDLAEVVELRASIESGLLKAALLHCASPDDNAPIFDALSELANMDDKQRQKEPISLLEQVELNWAGQEALMVRLLQLRDAELALAIMNDGEIVSLGELEIGSIEWLLDWLMDAEGTHLWWWLCDRISRLLGAHSTSTARDAFLAEFNRPDSKYRRVLTKLILWAHDDLSTDRFSEEAIRFRLASLREEKTADYLRGHLLGSTATESFVTERLLPQLSEAEEPLSTNLREVLKQAGSRHGRRYVAN